MQPRQSRGEISFVSKCPLSKLPPRQSYIDDKATPPEEIKQAQATAVNRIKEWLERELQEREANEASEQASHRKQSSGYLASSTATKAKVKKTARKTPASISSCGLTKAQIRALQSRELTPEDYDILLKLDESVEKRDVMSESEVARLLVESTFDADEEAECSICMCDCECGEAVVRLACSHVFHGPCLKKWAMRGRHTCPMCNNVLSQ